MAERAGIFDDQPEFDVSGFVPKAQGVAKEDLPDREAVRAVSEAANFPSREPATRKQTMPTLKRERRLHRTGRNIQLNMKVRAEDHEAFYAIANKHNWVLGEAFEHAIAALQRELAQNK
jgi:hypothetical protein